MENPSEEDINKITDKWFDYLRNEKKYSNHTIISYENDLNNFIEFQTKHLGQIPDKTSFAKITVQDIRAWLVNRGENQMTHRSSSRALSTMRSLYKHLNKNKILENHSFHNINSPKIGKTLPKALSVEDAISASQEIGSISDNCWVAKRDIALLTLIYGTGMRISEALSLSKSHLPIGDSVKIMGKGNKEREVPILPITRKTIDEYINLCPYNIDDHIFFGLRGKKLRANVFTKNLRNLRRLIGLPESCTPHSFRHSYATHLLEKGVDLRDIQELLGHQTIISTQIYTKINSKYLLEEYSKAHPKVSK